MSSLNETRLVDVFLLGPVQILVGLHVKNLLLKLFMIITGIMNILYNGHNYLYFSNRINKFNIFNQFTSDKSGKITIHRVYNLVIMYPIFLYVYLTTPLPKWLRVIFALDIIIGFAFNATFFVKYL